MSSCAFLCSISFSCLLLVYVYLFVYNSSLFCASSYLSDKMSYQKCSVFVEQIPVDSSEDELAAFFGNAGEIEAILLRKDSKGIFSGCAFVVYVSSTSVGKSITELSLLEFKDTKLQIRIVPEQLEEEICKLMSERKEGQGKPDPTQDVIDKLSTLSPSDLERVRTRLFPTVSAPNTLTGFGSPYQLTELPSFSGDSLKGDISYRQWRYHVQCFIQEGLNETAIMQAIRLSLRGTASEMLIYMSQSASKPITSGQIITKFDAVFGNALKVGQLYQQFYTAKQGKDESVVTWSLRLQKLYNTLLERAPPDEKPNPHMLRSIYFYGLTNEKVQDNNRHHFDSGLSFDELLKETRNTEFEFQQKSVPVLGANPKKTGTVHQVQMDKENDAKLTKVLDMVTSLGHRMDKMESKLGKMENAQQTHFRPRPKPGKPGETCSRCRRPGHSVQRCYATKDIDGNSLK